MDPFRSALLDIESLGMQLSATKPADPDSPEAKDYYERNAEHIQAHDAWSIGISYIGAGGGTFYPGEPEPYPEVPDEQARASAIEQLKEYAAIEQLKGCSPSGSRLMRYAAGRLLGTEEISEWNDTLIYDIKHPLETSLKGIAAGLAFGALLIYTASQI